MINARVNDRHLADNLARKADALAHSAAEDRMLARRQDSGRWRRAALLWPLFARNR